MKQISGFIIICLIITLGYFIGLLNFFTENEEDKCEMTYMFEYPQYVKISNNADKQFKKYGLYAYSEGRLTERTRNMYFDGIPVLFIPGNKGSHKQVRSLASVALRKWLNSKIPYHFDYFTVDLNDEYSGLYGPLLFDQLQYVNSSLYRIFELYQQQKNPPKSIILIGHSMGGVIAMKLLSEIGSNDLVPVVITLASPLKRNPVILDYHTEVFYKGILRTKINTTNIVSVAGGYRDLLIPPFLTEKRGRGMLHLITSNIPISWTECNHVQILWCKQVVMALNRALFDSVDPKTHQISSNLTKREMAFNHHLINHSGIKIRNFQYYFKEIQMHQKGRWLENIRKQYSIEHPNGLNEINWYMVAISSFAGYEKLSILAINMDAVEWVFACNAYYIKETSRICREGFHMTHKSEIVPSVKYKRRYFHVDLKELKEQRPELSHIVFRALPTDELLEFHVDVHGRGQRSLTVQLPAWFSFKNQVIVDRTDENALHYEIILPQLNHIVQYYKLYLEPMECSKTEHHASVTLTVPWSNENYHGFLTTSIKKPFNVRLFSSKPDNSSDYPVLKLVLDPSCKYRISIRFSIFGSLGQLARTYSPLLLANIAAVALMSLRHQYKRLKDGYCSILFVAIQEGAKPYYVITAYKISSRVLSLWFLPPFVPKPDHLYLIDDGIDFFLLPLILYLTSVGIFWVLTIAFSISLVALESTVHKLSLKLLARTVSFNMAWSDYLMGYLHKVPVIVALSLISMTLTTCGGIALCLGAVFYFLRLTQMSQDLVEEVVWYFARKFAKKCKNFLKKSKKDVNTQSLVVNDNLDLHSHGDCAKKRHITFENGSLMNDKTDDENFEDENVENTEIRKENTKKIEFENREDGDKGEEPTQENKESEIACDDASTEKELTENDKEETEDVNTNESKKTDIERETDELVPSKDRKREKRRKRSLLDDESELSSSYNAIFFHSTLFFLWCIVAVINIPAVLTWAHNFKYKTVLIPDESFIPGFSLSFCALALWHFEFPAARRKWTDEMGVFVFAMAVLSLVFAIVSLYRLNYILTVTIVVVTLHQLFAPISVDVGGEDSADSEKSKYSDLKMKME